MKDIKTALITILILNAGYCYTFIYLRDLKGEFISGALLNATSENLKETHKKTTK